MPIIKAQVNRYTCDNPKCPKEVYSEDLDVNGITGTVFKISESGGCGGDFWACSYKCLLPAAKWAIEESWRNPEQY